MPTLEPSALDQLFHEARTHSVWLDKPVDDELLNTLYDTVKYGPTAANSTPARFVFVKSAAAKERLVPCMSAGNQEKTRQAPVTVIVAYDTQFHEQLPKLFPHVVRNVRAVVAEMTVPHAFALNHENHVAQSSES